MTNDKLGHMMGCTSYSSEADDDCPGCNPDKRVEIETQLREYFYDIRGFRPMPVEFSYENVVDFVEWMGKR